MPGPLVATQTGPAFGPAGLARIVDPVLEDQLVRIILLTPQLLQQAQDLVVLVVQHHAHPVPAEGVAAVVRQHLHELRERVAAQQPQLQCLEALQAALVAAGVREQALELTSQAPVLQHHVRGER